MQAFDEERALAQARALAFPRLVGSLGEERAQAYIARELEDLGLGVAFEEFLASGPPRLLPKALTLVGLGLLGLAWAVHREHPYWAGLIPLGLILLVASLSRFWLRLGLGLSALEGRAHTSRNIITGLGEGKPALYLLAHYDSKSQRFGLPVRIGLDLLCALGLLGLAVLFSLRAAEGVLAALVLATAALASVGLFQKGGNASPGALDNAAGVGVLLELARSLAASPPPFRVNFVFTGAEESGLLGALAYLSANRERLRDEGALVVNLDGVGLRGKLRLITGLLPRRGGLVARLRAASGAPLSGFPLLPGLMMDHLPFLAAGLPAVSLACVGLTALSIHRPTDRPELIEPAGLAEVGGVLQRFISGLAGSGPGPEP